MIVILLAILIVSFTSEPVFCQASAQGNSPSVYDTAVEYNGWQGSITPVTELSEIRIGLFTPNDSNDAVNLSVHRAAILAIENANTNGGYFGLPFKIVNRWSDDPWGAASKEMIRLVYKDSVWAVVGSIDGATSHIAEQIVTKSRLPLLSPLATDPTLNYIRIPWMFRLPPDDEAQAAVIYKQGIQVNALKRIGILTTSDHDGRIFGAEMSGILLANGIYPILHFQIPPDLQDFKQIINRIEIHKPDGLILKLPWQKVALCLFSINDRLMQIPVFMPWIPGLQKDDFAGGFLNDVYVVDPFSELDNDKFVYFSKIYYKKFKAHPPKAAAYTYDSINLIIHSIKKGGLNRARLRNALAREQNFYGVSGKINWDNTGSNCTIPKLVNISAVNWTNILNR